MKIEAITNNRLSYMDIAKGFGILCVIAGHMGNETINRFVFSFHMPLFFLISGYFISERLCSSDLFKIRVRQLIPPYIFTCLVVILLSTVKTYIGVFVGTKSIQDIYSVLVKWVYASLYGAGTSHETPFSIIHIGAVWFLLATISSNYFAKRADETRHPILFVASVAFIGYVTSMFLWLPWSIQCGMTATPFVYFGMWLKESGFFDKSVKEQFPLFVVSFVAWTCEIIFSHPWMDIAQNRFPLGPIDFIGGGLSALCVILIVKYFYEKYDCKILSKGLTWFGRNSLIMLCFHLIELNCIPWSRLLSVVGITDHLFIPIFLLKVTWCVVCVFFVNHSQLKNVFYRKERNGALS